MPVPAVDLRPYRADDIARFTAAFSTEEGVGELQWLEQALMDRLQDTLLALGHGMAFVGRQVRFDVDGGELVLDLLLF